jgi:oligopeptidase B
MAGKDFRIVEAPIATVGDRATWRDVVPHRSDAFVASFDAFDAYLAVSERSGGLQKLRVRSWDGKREFLIDAADPAYTMALGNNAEQDTTLLRYVYTSPTTPSTTYDYDMANGNRKLLKQEPVLGGFDSTKYASEFRFATARDGTRIRDVALPARHTARRHSAALSVRLRLLRLFTTGIPLAYLVAGRSGLRLCDRPHPRRPGNGPRLVRERQAAQEEEQLHGLHRRDAVSGGREDRRSEARLRHGRQCGRPADGGNRQHGAQGLQGAGGSRAFRGRGHHHARREHSADHQWIPTEWSNPGKDRAAYDYMLGYSPYDQASAQEYPRCW